MENLHAREREAQRLFRKAVSQLYQLRNPHVTKLYGACHRGEKPFLVMEYGQSGALRSFVGKQPQVTRGVQYLHERGILHRQLRGNNILLGDDGLVKLSAFGVYSMALSTASSIEWVAPEDTEKEAPSFESDVYSLGMCIIEAMSGESSYVTEAAEYRNLKQFITAGVAPKRPATFFSTRGWELVTQMTCFHPGKRLKIADVVSELAALARDEIQEASNVRIDSAGTICALENTYDVKERLALALMHLSTKSRDNNDEETGYDIKTPERQVVLRLRDVYQATKSHLQSHHQLVLPRIQYILARFTNTLQTQASLGRAASFAAERQHADRVLSFHNEIDRFLDQHSELLKPQSVSATATRVHMWRDRWYAHRRLQLQEFVSTLEQVEALDVETCTCLLFELTKRLDSYTSIPPLIIHSACTKMRKMPGVHVPDWFISHYEVAIDAFQSFRRGAFGSVHHGEWMGSRCVIKKVFADNDDEFQKEADTWSRLYHPHVLQLFGACHEPARRNREVWRTLHEAALGLHYLHLRGVVHCDLKCNNILIGRDGNAKVSDYRLSRRQQEQSEPEASDSSGNPDHPVNKATGVGAPRWNAPEVLNGLEPTIESDVYSFGMCVVEAVTGEYPWGMKDRDELISDHVRRGGVLFSIPRGFSEAQWGLVVGACCVDPKERLRMADVVAQLEVFAHDASKIESDDGVVTTIDEVAEPEPAMKTASGDWSDSAAFSEVVLPGAFDNLSLESVGSGSCATDSSYSESW